MKVCLYLPTIGLVVERSRNARLLNCPLALAADTGHIIVACNQARERGVRSGMAVTAARTFCPNLEVLPYNAETYRDEAETVWDMLAEESNSVEPVTPELCYAEFPDAYVMRRVYWLSAQIEKQIGVPVKIGVAPSKMAAYHAARTGQDAITRIQPGDEPTALAMMPLAKLPAMTDTLLERFKRLGLRTLHDVQQTPVRELDRQFGREQSRRLQRLSQGIDDDAVKAQWPPLRIEREITFDDPSYSLPAIEAALMQCVDRIAAELIARHHYCRSMGLVLALEEGTYVRECERLAVPTHDRSALHSCAKRLLSRLRVHHGIVSMKLMASDIDAGTGRQLTLLDSNSSGVGYPHEREQALASTISYMRKRLGADAITSVALFAVGHSAAHFTESLTKRKAETISVTTTLDGRPLSWQRRGKRGMGDAFHVTRIVDHWRLGDWWQDAPLAHYYRVETWPPGLYDLQRSGDQWQLRGIAD